MFAPKMDALLAIAITPPPLTPLISVLSAITPAVPVSLMAVARLVPSPTPKSLLLKVAPASSVPILTVSHVLPTKLEPALAVVPAIPWLQEHVNSTVPLGAHPVSILLSVTPATQRFITWETTTPASSALTPLTAWSVTPPSPKCVSLVVKDTGKTVMALV